MLLIFGFRESARLLATVTRPCGRCGNRAPHEVLELARRLSLFFVPLFRVGALRYADVCTVCGWDTDLTEAQARSAASVPDGLGPQDAPPPTPQDRR